MMYFNCNTVATLWHITAHVGNITKNKVIKNTVLSQSGQIDNVSQIKIQPLKAGKGQPPCGTSWETHYFNRAG